MHGLILAGGEGARLAADGVATPKALAVVGGRAQLLALADRLHSLGCASVTALVHEDVLAWLARHEPLARALGERARLISCRTPSSLHTLAAGLDALPPGDVCCTLVDTVMPADDWRAVYAAFQRAIAAGADAVLALTPPTGDDDAPLWVTLAPDGTVARVGGAPATPPRVTGGVYAFAPAARRRVPRALAAGRARLRAFLADLVETGARVQAVDVARIIDIDHKRDLEAANAFAAAWARAPDAAMTRTEP